MKKGLEVYLVSFALALLASIILYQVYMTPNLSPAVIKKAVGNSNVENQNKTTTNFSSNINDNTKNIDNNVSKYSGEVNINTAGVEELITLPGIGEVKANAIIQYRNKNGKFSNADDLTNVNGIGTKTVDKIRYMITF